MSFNNLFNIGQTSGIDIPGEERGILPTKEWFNINHPNQPFYKGYLMNLAIGQGDIRMTPLQIAVLYTTLANNGVIMKPKVVTDIISADGKSKKMKDEVIKVLDIDKSVFENIKSALWAVTNEPGGTAYRYAD